MWFSVVCTLICCETVFSSDTSTKHETAIFKICSPAIITSPEVIIAEYDAILGQWEREDFYNHLSNYTNDRYSSDVSAETRSTYWPTSTDNHVCRHSADTSPPLGRHSADTLPTLGRHSADTLPTLGRHSADTSPTLGRHSADTLPALGKHYTHLVSSCYWVLYIFSTQLSGAFSGRRPFLAFNSGNIHVFFPAIVCFFLVIAFTYDSRYFRK